MENLKCFIAICLLFIGFSNTDAQPCLESDSLELVRFYDATGGPGWTNTWNLNAPVSTWYGVFLSGDGCSVTCLDLDGNVNCGLYNSNYASGNNLIGNLVDLKLPNLTGLHLSINRLSGNIPDFQFMTNMTELSLSYNQLSGNLPDFQFMTTLTGLYLYNNQLSGNIPDFQFMTNLSILDLNYNQLSGNIPGFQFMTNLTTLDLSYNQLTGSIPDFQFMSNLTTLDLSTNQLTGSLPDFQFMPNLMSLNLHSNQLSGNVPDFQFMPNLTELHILYNQLSGNVPDFQFMTNLTELSLNSNQLSGNVPDFEFMTNMTRLGLSNNQLSGDIPDFQFIPNLTWLFLDNNQLSGSIPDFQFMPNLTVLFLHNNQLSGSIPDFQFMPNLLGIWLLNNELSGNIPDFQFFPNLRNLSLTNNQLSGNIPDFQFMPDLTSLSLSDNQFSGNIPDFLFIPDLTRLDLAKNQLSGSIPDFQFLPNLSSLDLAENLLSGTIPDFQFLPNLASLELGWNQLSSNIPDFQFLPNLGRLYLNDNQFNFGHLFFNLDSNLTIQNFRYAPQGSIPTIQNLNSFSVNAGDTQNNTYYWYKNGTPIDTLIADSIYIPNSSGNYQCRVENTVVTRPQQYQDLELWSTSIYFNLPLSATINNITHISCNGENDGSTTIIATGGTSPYNFLWDNGETTATATALGEGNHLVTITDADSNTQTTSTTINEPDLLLPGSSVSQHLDCFGDSDGSASVSVVGGTTPYSYLWDNGETTPIATGLTGGNHSVTITDANNCTANASETIIEPVEFIANTTVFNEASCGNADGVATVDVSGGTPPYSFSWNTGETTAMAMNLAAGNYNATITDANNCTTSTSVTMPLQPSLFASTEQDNSIICNSASNGYAANISTTGGTPPYTYLWSNGETTAIATGLAVGAYTATITDINACMATTSVQINDPISTTFSLIIFDNSLMCADVTRNFLVVGSFASYSFVVNGIEMQNSSSNTFSSNDLQNGDVVSSEAYDADGCLHISANSIVIEAYEIPLISTCNPAPNNLQITLTQGTPPWTFDLLGTNDLGEIDTSSFIVYGLDTTLAQSPNIQYEIQGIGLASDACAYNDAYATGYIEGCAAVCVGYGNPYTESYTANFANTTSTVQWSVFPADALTNGDISIVGSQTGVILEVDFSNANPINSQIILQATASTTCGMEMIEYLVKLDSDCLWAGDINQDGQVNNNGNINWINDALGLGFAFTTYNALTVLNQNNETLLNLQRPLGCLALNHHDWLPQSSENWLVQRQDGSTYSASFDIKDSLGQIVSNHNLKFADSNGGGTIDQQIGWQSPQTQPFPNEPTDYDIITYQVEMGNTHSGNAPAKTTSQFTQLLHIEASQEVFDDGDEVVFTVKLGSATKDVENVRHIAFVGEGAFGTYGRPSVELAYSHLTNLYSGLVDYPFLKDDYVGNTSDSLVWYTSLTRREDTQGVHFSGEDVCSVICHVTVADLVGNSPNNRLQLIDSLGIPVTFRIDNAGIGTADNRIIYASSNEVTIYIRPNPYLRARLMLDGPYEPSNGMMKDELRINNLIPATEPFTQLGYPFPHEEMQGMRMTDSTVVLAATGEKAIVDWVFIEIRDKECPDSLITSRPALLTRNGQVVEMDGQSIPRLWNIGIGDYYVVVRHRNHIPAMTAHVVSLDANGPIVDLIGATAFGLGTKKLDNGTHVLYAGDTNGDGLVDAADRNNTWNDRNMVGLHNSDCDLNGIMDSNDRSITWNNRNSYSRVP